MGKWNPEKLKNHKGMLGKIQPQTMRDIISKTQKGRKHQPQECFKKGHIDLVPSEARKRAGKNQRGKIMPSKENHWNWKGGIAYSPYSTDWTETLRISIRERDKYTCCFCGKKQGDRAFSIHHIDYNKLNCNPNNLITLCESCHIKTNFNRTYWIKFFNYET